IYSGCEPVCHYNNINDHGEPERDTDLQCGGTDLFGSNACRAANDIKQWYHGKLVTGTEQYRYYNLYIYSGCEPVCHYNNTNDHGEPERDTDIQCGGTDLFGSNACRIANDIKQWYHGKLVTGIEQHDSHNIYIYSGCEPVCHYNNINDHGEPE